MKFEVAMKLFLKTTLKWHIGPIFERSRRIYPTYVYILWTVFKRAFIKNIFPIKFLISRLNFEMTMKLFLKTTLKWHISPISQRSRRFYSLYVYIFWKVFKRAFMKYILFLLKSSPVA
jgi:hypothetical protein